MARVVVLRRRVERNYSTCFGHDTGLRVESKHYGESPVYVLKFREVEDHAQTSYYYELEVRINEDAYEDKRKITELIEFFRKYVEEYEEALKVIAKRKYGNDEHYDAVTDFDVLDYIIELAKPGYVPDIELRYRCVDGDYLKRELELVIK